MKFVFSSAFLLFFAGKKPDAEIFYCFFAECGLEWI